MEQVMAQEMGRIEELDLLQSAGQSSFAAKIDLACVSYIRKAYPIADYEMQSSFEAVLLLLFYRIREGYVCIRADGLDSFERILREWEQRIDFTSASPGGNHEQLANDREYKSYIKMLLPKTAEDLARLIAASPAVATAEDAKSMSPLVLDLGRLYVRRYFNYELQAGRFIRQSSFQDFEGEERAKFQTAVGILFPKETEDLLPDGTDHQKIAAVMAGISDFTVISGGPGTGKTTTVFKVLVLLLCSRPEIRTVRLCAPTAKAAARMGESIAQQKSNEETLRRIEQVAKLYGTDREALLSRIPVQAETVHSMLRITPHKTSPSFNAEHRLDCDLLIADEVSMLDLTLCAKLTAALHDGCRVIMLGDKDQLSSVGEGKVLGDICSVLDRSGEEDGEGAGLSERVRRFICDMTGYSERKVDDLARRGQIADRIVLLVYSWRSKNAPYIGRLAGVVNSGGRNKAARMRGVFAEQASSIATGGVENIALERLSMASGDSPEKTAEGVKSLLEQRRRIVQSWIDPEVKNSYAAFLEKLKSMNFCAGGSVAECEELFGLIDRFRVLCSNHNGYFGDRALNMLLEQEILDRYVNPEAGGRFGRFNAGDFFPGKLVLITENDRTQGLFNGTVGFCAYPDGIFENEGTERKRHDSFRERRYKDFRSRKVRDERLRVFLPVPDARTVKDVSATPPLSVSTLFVNSYEPGFVMSIHKSQGSEYNKVDIVLSEKLNPVLTKELVYTGITRAKEQVRLVCPEHVLNYAIAHSVVRESGLALRIGNNAEEGTRPDAGDGE